MHIGTVPADCGAYQIDGVTYVIPPGQRDEPLKVYSDNKGAVFNLPLSGENFICPPICDAALINSNIIVGIKGRCLSFENAYNLRIYLPSGRVEAWIFEANTTGALGGPSTVQLEIEPSEYVFSVYYAPKIKTLKGKEMFNNYRAFGNADIYEVPEEGYIIYDSDRVPFCGCGWCTEKTYFSFMNMTEAARIYPKYSELKNEYHCLEYTRMRTCLYDHGYRLFKFIDPYFCWVSSLLWNPSIGDIYMTKYKGEHYITNSTKFIGVATPVDIKEYAATYDYYFMMIAHLDGFGTCFVCYKFGHIFGIAYNHELDFTEYNKVAYQIVKDKMEMLPICLEVSEEDATIKCRMFAGRSLPMKFATLEKTFGVNEDLTPDLLKQKNGGSKGTYMGKSFEPKENEYYCIFKLPDCTIITLRKSPDTEIMLYK